jgi:hypothetical protein
MARCTGLNPHQNQQETAQRAVGQATARPDSLENREQLVLSRDSVSLPPIVVIVAGELQRQGETKHECRRLTGEQRDAR